MSAQNEVAPLGEWEDRLLRWRSSDLFILTTVCIATFTDGFVYSVIVPVLPYVLEDHYHVAPGQGLLGVLDCLDLADAISTILDLSSARHFWRHHPYWLAGSRDRGRSYQVAEASLVFRVHQSSGCRHPSCCWR
jgi:hypothetical protein